MSRLSALALASAVAAASILSAAPASRADADRAQETITQTRAAIGGDEKIRSVQGLTAAGKFRRVFGERESSGEREVSFQLPDKYSNADTFAVGGLNTSVTSAKVLNGERAGTTGRGGMMIIGGSMTEEQKQAMFRRNIQSEWARYLIGLLLTSQPSFPVEFKYAGEAEADDGKADVLDATGPDKFAVRLFIDKQTRLPLMLTYTTTGRRGNTPIQLKHGASKEEMDRLLKEQADKMGPPVQIEHQIRFADYRKVGGLMLPHRITQGTDGAVNEEWEILKYEINPKFKSDAFQPN